MRSAVRRAAVGFGLLSAAFLALPALASTVFIFVSASRDKACLPATRDEKVELHYLLTPSETTEALRRYFRGEQNPELYDAAIVNAGLKFCGSSERSDVFRALLAELNVAKPDKRIFEVIRNYSLSNTLLREIRSCLSEKGLRPEFRRNLEKAEALVLETRGR